MSLITDVVVVALCNEDAAIAEVNEHLAEANDGQQLEPLSMDAAGGFKAISARVYAASFNYLNCDDLRAALISAPWRLPRHVTFSVYGETWDERFWPGMKGTPE